MGTPVTGFLYQEKFEGQFDFIVLSRNGLITPEQFPNDNESLCRLFEKRIQQSDDLAVQIRNRFGFVKSACLRNFEGVDSVFENS